MSGPPVMDGPTQRSDERPPSRLSAVEILRFGILSVVSAVPNWDSVQELACPIIH